MNPSDTPVSNAALELLRHVSTATLTTQLFKRGLRNVFLQGVAPLVKPAPGAPNLVGPAFTPRNIPAREDLDHVGVFQDPDHPQRKAVESAPPGSVLVQDCRGDRSVASVGSILALRLAKRGVAGMGSAGAGRGRGEVCGPRPAPRGGGVRGVWGYPGDIVVAEVDGVVIVPREMAEEVARDATEQEQLEIFISQRIEEGRPLRGTYPPNEETLAAYAQGRAQKQ